jgi:hypothetical protein
VLSAGEFLKEFDFFVDSCFHFGVLEITQGGKREYARQRMDAETQVQMPVRVAGVYSWPYGLLSF